MAEDINADLIILELKKGHEGKYVKCMIRKNPRNCITLDVRVMILGDT